MSVAQSIRSSSKWLISGNLLGQVLQFGFGIALARLLVPADFGMIVTIQIFTGMLGLVASGGMGQALIRSTEAEEEDFQVIFSIQLAVGILIYAGFFIIAPWFAIWFDNPLYKDLLRISAISFVMRPFLSMHSIWLKREMRFKDTSSRSLIAKVISGTLSILMALSGWGVWSLLFGGLLGSVANYLMIFRLTPLRVRLRYRYEIARHHSGYGIKIVLNEVVSYMRKQTSNFIISQISGASMLGLFNKGDSLAKLPFTTISSPIYDPVFRAMSIEQDNPDKIKYLYFKMASLLMLYTLPFYIGLWWLAKPFIVEVYGAHWADAATPLEILAPLGLLYCIGHPCGAVLAATNRLGREVVVQTTTWIIVGFGCYFGLKWEGLAGAAFGVVLSQLYSTTHMYILANQVFKAKFRELVTAVGPAILLNAILVGTLVIVDAVLPVGFSGEHGLLYLCICFLSGGLAYAAAFLLLPLPTLALEASRWKELLRLAPRHV